MHLIDAEDGKGMTRVTEHGVVAGGKEYPVDVIIWGTGYASPLTGSVGGRAGIDVIGDGGVAMEDQALAGTLDTLHGCIAPAYPNLLYLGLSQCGVGPNQTHRMDVVSTHIAYILAAAAQRVPGGAKPIVRPTPAAAEQWAQQVAAVALTAAPMAGCTPSYFNLEGDLDRLPDEVKAHLARGGAWGRGMNDFARLCADWRAEGDLKGLEISAA